MPPFWLKVKVYILFVVHVNIHVMAIKFECVGQISQDYTTFRVFIKWNFVIYFRVLHIHNLFCLYFKLIMEWMQWLQFPAQHFVMKVLHILVSNFLILEKFLLFLLLANKYMYHCTNWKHFLAAYLLWFVRMCSVF